MDKANLIEEFLKKTMWRKFASVDFEHYLNRKGVFVTRRDIEETLLASAAVKPTEDGMWRKA